MTSNGVVSFPSSQILYAISGYFAYTGELTISLIIGVGALGHSLGNYILYEIARRRGVKYASKFVKFFFQLSDPEREIKKFQTVFNKKSIFWLFVGKLVNPIKVFIPIPAGIAEMRRTLFLPIVYVTSAIWASIFTFIGFYFGKSYENFGYIGAIILILAVIVMGYFYKLMNSKEIIEEVDKK